MILLVTYVAVLACFKVDIVGSALTGLPSPAAIFPLNAQFGTADISNNESPPGIASGVRLADGPDGQPGGSYYFSGSSTSYIEFPRSNTLDTRHSLTLLADVFPESSGPIFNYNAVNCWGVHWWVFKRSLFWRLLDRYNYTFYQPVISKQIITGKWSYVGATYNYSSGIARIWIDGAKAGEVQVGKMEIATNDSVRIGALTHDPRYLQGRVSCLQIYNRTLTQDEIEAVKSRCLKIKPFSMCFDYVLIADETRSTKFVTKGTALSDYGSLSESWYRFNSASGRAVRLASNCVPEQHCGSESTGWLNGSYPLAETSIERVEACFSFGGKCCASKTVVYVRQCSGYYVYKFENMQHPVTPKRRFCTEEFADSTSPRTTTGYIAVMGSDLVGTVIYTESGVSSIEKCAGYCTLHPECMALNYNPLAKLCELSNVTRESSPMVSKSGFHYYEAVKLTVYYF